MGDHGLRRYLEQKKAALAALDRSDAQPTTIAATTTAEGRSGIRRVRVRHHQVVNDSPPAMAGYDLAPTSQEAVLGALGACLVHTFLIQAARRDVTIDAIEIDVTATIHPKAGSPGHDAIPIPPQGIAYHARIDSPADPATLAELQREVERTCPILNLIRQPQPVTGAVEQAGSGAAGARS